MNGNTKLQSKIGTASPLLIKSAYIAHCLLCQFSSVVSFTTLAAPLGVGYGRKSIAACDVLPMGRARHGSNGFALYAEHIAKLLMGVITRGIQGSNLGYLFGRKLRTACTLTTRSALGVSVTPATMSSGWVVPALPVTIGGIVASGSKKQMGWIAANRIIAGVAHKVFGGVNAITQVVRNAMGLSRKSFKLELSIPHAGYGQLPGPTLARIALLDVEPKAGSVGSGHSRKGFCFSHCTAS